MACTGSSNTSFGRLCHRRSLIGGSIAIRDGYLDERGGGTRRCCVTRNQCWLEDALRVMAKPHHHVVAGHSRRPCWFVPLKRHWCWKVSRVLRARGQQAWAEVCGFGSTSDADHLAQPSGSKSRAMRQAAAVRFATRADSVSQCAWHGCRHGDVIETQSIRAVFGDASGTAVSSTKVDAIPDRRQRHLEFFCSTSWPLKGRTPPLRHWKYLIRVATSISFRWSADIR